jgi:hypothetical protein
VPIRSEIYESVKIGMFWNNVKQGHIKGLYSTLLCKNSILREDYEKVQNLKEEKKSTRQYTALEKSELLLEFVEKFSRVPRQSEIYESVKIGVFWNSVKQGIHKDLYTTLLCKNSILQKSYESLQNLRGG